MTAETYTEEARREKLEALREREVEPFAYGYRRTHLAQECLDAFERGEEPTVAVAGRLVSMRRHGKTTFIHLEDRSGRIQVYFRKDEIGEGPYEVVKLLDLGDFIGVKGTIFRTKTGETTIKAGTFALLAKSLRPLPLGKKDAEGDLHGGLHDTETRYRQRYADLAVHREVREVFELRARVVAAIRRFLDQRGYVEVETPVLQPLYGGAMARPFVTHHNSLDLKLYLRIATELYLKRCIVGGLEKVYEIGKDFRNEGIDRTHNPEFTMLEFYEAYADYEDMLLLTEELVHEVVTEVCGSPVLERFGTAFDFSRPFRRAKFLELVSEHADIDAMTASEEDLRAALRPEVDEDLSGWLRPQLVDESFKKFVEPHLQQPTFVTDYPIELCPLAKPKRGEPSLAERFELFLAGTELANAFSELNDPDDQRRRFEEQARARELGDVEAQQYDEDYVRALEYGMPPTGGCGVGIDRLLMVMAGQHSIRDVVLFPHLRPEE